MDSTTARVWIGAKRRRYLTKSGAAYSLAREQWRSKYPCECEKAQGSYPGQVCLDHQNPNRMMAVIERLARWIRKGVFNGR